VVIDIDESGAESEHPPQLSLGHILW